jgi:cobalt/nickel transport system permease protein
VLYSPVPMHVPDGFLSTLVSLIMWFLSILCVGYALRKAGKDLGERQVPVMGVLAATIFAGQMLNFSVAGGTSGHLLGAAIATILLGPLAAVIVMTSVVSIQALVFQDGGLLALGANIFNMAVVGVNVAYFVHASMRKILGNQNWAILASGAISAWTSIVVTAFACALELAFSGTSPANIAIPAMGGIHMLIGIGEALITVGTLSFLLNTRKDLLDLSKSGQSDTRTVWLLGLGLALFLVIFAPFASTNPDGLEWVAKQNGFLDRARAPIISLLPEYIIPGVSNQAFATIAAGMIGVVLVFVVVVGLAFLRRKSKS